MRRTIYALILLSVLISGCSGIELQLARNCSINGSCSGIDYDSEFMRSSHDTLSDQNFTEFTKFVPPENLTIYVWDCVMNWTCSNGDTWEEHYAAEWDKKEYAPQQTALAMWAWGPQNPTRFDVSKGVYKKCWARFYSCKIISNNTKNWEEYHTINSSMNVVPEEEIW